MSQKPTWTKENAHHYAVELAGRRVDLQYEQSGFQSGWAVYAGDRLIERCAELMQARGLALRLATAGA
ncbi:hypothetical protein [Azospirillum thermophilum]|uniref:Uncharacterized protein n=1 Tax=Azospirillum thermophilum TaxID=2202148 RepID=A0A2S2CM87_9PROT|nr:hypothetical protein [Azospirillum thermophilum]AWK85591.1 hypothetical protein DEW08_04900 [Azospirillum thermophilum]